MKHKIKTTARIGGLLYLVNIAFGLFAIGYVTETIVVANDAAATAQNLLAHEHLYRLGLIAHVIILLTNIPLAVVFFRIFKVVNRNATIAVVLFTIVGTSIEAVNVLNQFAPLLLLKGAGAVQHFSREQLQDLAYMFTRLQSVGFNLALVFYGCYGISIGYLIYRSGFLPRAIGVLMVVGGSCYVFYSFANFLSPAFSNHLVPWLQIPSGLAELSLCLWLIVVGMNVRKWEEKLNLGLN